MARTRANAAEWARRVASWRSSGASASEFAAREGWNARTLTWWGTQLRRRGRETPPASPVASFVEVVERRAPVAVPTVGTLDLIVAGVGTLRISTGTDLVLLRAVVDALGGRQ